MPHYQLNDEEKSYLIAYLKNLSSAIAPGIDEKRIHFASIVTEGIDPIRYQAMNDVFQTFLKDKNYGYRFEHIWVKNPIVTKERQQRALREWTIHPWRLDGPVETWSEQLHNYYQRQPVFALLGGLTDNKWQPIHDFCEQQNIPCVFPNTDLPVISDDDFYTVYFSKGATLEAQILGQYLTEQTADGSDHIIQVYRQDDAFGATAATVLHERLSTHVTDKAIAADALLDKHFWLSVNADQSQKNTLILWLRPKEIDSLKEVPEVFANVDRVYLSSSLISDVATQISEVWRDKVYFIHPFALPNPPSQGILRTTAWLQMKRVPMTHARIQANTLAALTMTNAALTHMVDYYSREYFLEQFEHGADDFLTASVYNRFSLGPGQRFASKGAYITKLSTQGRPAMQAVSEWIIP